MQISKNKMQKDMIKMISQIADKNALEYLYVLVKDIYAEMLFKGKLNVDIEGGEGIVEVKFNTGANRNMLMISRAALKEYAAEELKSGK